MLSKIIKNSLIGFSMLPMALGAVDYKFNSLENVSWDSESAWTPNGAPGAADNAIFSNHLTSTKEITIPNFKEVNDISFDGLYIGARLFINTVQEGSIINGNVYVGDTYLYNNDVWRCVGIRGRNFPLTIKGSIIFNATGASKNINGTDYTSRPIINIGGDWNSTVASSIEIGENAVVDSKTGLKAAIILDTSISKVYQNLYFGLATDQEKGVVIHNVVQLNYAAGQAGTRLTLGKLGGGYLGDQNISIGGINGYGTLATCIINGSTADGTPIYAKSNLTLTNAAGVNTYYEGNLFRENTDYNDSFTITMDGDGKQTMNITSSSANFISSVTVKKGDFVFHSPINSGSLRMEGGSFSAINGGVTFNSASWAGGKFVFASEPIQGGTADKITVNGKFVKEGGEKIVMDFSGLDAESILGATYDLISAGSFEDAEGNSLTDSDADDYFSAIINNALADFSWSDNTLQVTFVQVPEPAALSLIFGALAVGYALRRRK